MRIGLAIIFGVIVGILSWLWFRNQREKRETAERIAAFAAGAEGFQTSTASPAPNAQCIGNCKKETFWQFVADLKSSDKTLKNNAEQILIAVSEPSESGDDAFNITFPKYVSIYAWSQYGVFRDYTSEIASSAVVSARKDLFNNYDSIQTNMINTVYDPVKVSAWTTDPKVQSCTALDVLKTTFLEKRAGLRTKMQDLSGTAVLAGKMRDENMMFQNKYINICQTEPMSKACEQLASQEPKIFPLLTEYDNVNTELFVQEIDISETVKTINQTFDLLQCNNPNFSFESERDIGTVDTELLRSKLETLSPYYLSPDTLKYITQFLLSAEEVDEVVAQASDRFLLVNKNLTALNRITG